MRSRHDPPRPRPRYAAALQRLEEELAVIAELRHDIYFLTVAQVVADVREIGIRVAARGSGAGSMVNHASMIATANPMDHRLSVVNLG